MNYVQLNTVSVLRPALMVRAHTATNWVANNGIERIELNLSDFWGDPKIVDLIRHFDCQTHRKLSIFRFMPNTCHSWHMDLQRFAAINMLIDGWDSLTVFGCRHDAINLVSIDRLKYAQDRYYLMNSKRQHSVLNFDNVRYLLSIGIPEKYTFQDVLSYVEKEGT